MYAHPRFPPPQPPPPLSMPNHLTQLNHYALPSMSASTPVASSPSSPRTDRREEDHSDLPSPPPMTTIFDNKVWALDVVQQPVRARMCGFGDKDRRPITPPPCVRLIIMDPETKKEVDFNDVDTSYFVLTVDLWDVEAKKEVNLVKHAPANSPAISAVNVMSYPPTSSNPMPGQPTPQPYAVSEIPSYSRQSFASPITAQPPSSATTYYSPSSAASYYGNGVSAAYPAPAQYGYQDQRYGQSSHYQNGYPQHSPSISHQPGTILLSPYQQQPNGASANGTAGMFTRNLIGSLSASAFKLVDTNDRVGIWFILQDLSVRTEGWFRLKMNFVNVGHAVDPADPNSPAASSSSSNGVTLQTLTRTTAPVLASVFSKPFQVFSAKKFPGVIESTDLSRTFANQGIKIPIRKDPVPPNGKSSGRKDSQDDDDGDNDE